MGKKGSSDAYGAVSAQFAPHVLDYIEKLAKGGHTYTSLDKLLGVTRGTFSSIMTGERQPSWRIAALLAQEFQVSIGEVLGEDPVSQQPLGALPGYSRIEREVKRHMDCPADFWLALRDTIFHPPLKRLEYDQLYMIAKATWAAYGDEFDPGD